MNSHIRLRLLGGLRGFHGQQRIYRAVAVTSRVYEDKNTASNEHLWQAVLHHKVVAVLVLRYLLLFVLRMIRMLRRLRLNSPSLLVTAKPTSRRPEMLAVISVSYHALLGLAVSMHHHFLRLANGCMEADGGGRIVWHVGLLSLLATKPVPL
jgi:hypothetical protein